MENLNKEQRTLNWLKDGVGCLTGWMLIAVGIGVSIYGFVTMKAEKAEEQAEEQQSESVQDVPFKVVEE